MTSAEAVLGGPVVDDSFRAMGCAARVLLVGGDEALADAARHRIEDLEARWSRFRPESELSRLGDRPGVPVVVSQETFTLVERAVRGWEATGGLYDPTVGDAVAALGYDQSFDLLAARPRAEPQPAIDAEPSPGCVGIGLDPLVRAVVLPPGVHIDPGGIGKGLAGDLVVAEMIAAGVQGVLIDLGGDLRVAGTPPDGRAWTISIEDPLDPERELARVGLLDGAVVTTSVTWRTWDVAGRSVHHIVDPSTGDVSASDVISATVVAGDGWWGEVLAKAAFLAGLDAGADLVAEAGATGVLVGSARRVREVDGFDAYRRSGDSGEHSR